MSIFYFENFRVEWDDMPSRWVDRNSSANTINIELKTVKDNPNPLLYKLIFYVHSGTITVQGNHYRLFVKHFKTLKKILKLVLQNCGMSSDVTKPCPISSSDSDDYVTDDTIVKVKSNTDDEVPIRCYR